MKKCFILAAVALLSGCAYLSELSFDWNSLNPWAGDAPEAEKTAEPAQDVLPASVNKYLWNASVEKLAFMGVETKNIQEGLIVTEWRSPAAFQSERFKIRAEINSGELRADGLNVKVYKEVKNGSGWRTVPPSPALKAEIEQAIIKQAKILYINDKDKE